MFLFAALIVSIVMALRLIVNVIFAKSAHDNQEGNDDSDDDFSTMTSDEKVFC